MLLPYANASLVVKSVAHARCIAMRVILRAALSGQQARILRGRVRREAVQVSDFVQDGAAAAADGLAGTLVALAAAGHGGRLRDIFTAQAFVRTQASFALHSCKLLMLRPFAKCSDERPDYH